MPRKLMPPPVDIAIAVLLTVFAVGVTLGPARWYTHMHGHHYHWSGTVLLGIGSLALAWRRSFPLTVLITSASAVLLYYVLGFPGGPVGIAPAVALGTYAYLRGAARAATAGGAFIGLSVLLELLLNDFLDRTLAQAAGLVLGGTAAIAVGIAVRARAASRLAAINEAAEASRRRSEEERLAIAREVHDVVAHSLAMINVQAGVGSHVADRRPEEAKKSLVEIKKASQSALDDLRKTLAVLRGSGDRAPAPGLDRLPELVASTRSAGLDVTVEGTPATLPAHVDTAAYRILQESLTNVVRHATGARTVTITLQHTDDGLDLTVTDDGNPPGTDANSSGNGLRGMAERARVLGGWVSAAPRPGRGFRVRAWLPVTGGRS